MTNFSAHILALPSRGESGIYGFIDVLLMIQRLHEYDGLSQLEQEFTSKIIAETIQPFR